METHDDVLVPLSTVVIWIKNRSNSRRCPARVFLQGVHEKSGFVIIFHKFNLLKIFFRFFDFGLLLKIASYISTVNKLNLSRFDCFNLKGLQSVPRSWFMVFYHVFHAALASWQSLITTFSGPCFGLGTWPLLFPRGWSAGATNKKPARNERESSRSFGRVEYDELACFLQFLFPCWEWCPLWRLVASAGWSSQTPVVLIGHD